VADKLAATTDRNGAARLLVPKLPPLSGPADLQSELTFTDLSGEVQTVSQRLRLWPAAVVVGLRLSGWAAARGEVPFTALVLSTDGKVLPGRAVQVQAVQHTTISTRKRIVGGFYSYDNRRESKPLGVVCSGNTDAQGRLSCKAKLDVSGEVEFQATAKDDAGRSSSATASAWLSSADQMWFAQDNDDRIDLLPERREVEPGQTARLQVRMPFLQATALVTVEREGVIDARVVTLNGREPVIEVPIPKSAGSGTDTGVSWAPNVVVSAFVLRGRLREAPWWSLFTWGWKEPGEWWRAFRYEGKEWRAPTALVDLAKPSFKLGVAELKVGLADHRLDVKVSAPQPQYGVRETVKATISVRRGGQPLAGVEVAFAAVDEGLLALQGNGSWALLEAMLQPRPWAVETATAQGEIIGRRHYGRKALPPGGGGGRNPTRELFDTLLLWRGTVVLDAQGQAVVDVPLNDSLTSFRLVAVADAGTALFGTGSTSVRVTQDLQMLSGLSPLARAGDRFDAGFTLRNTTARAMTVTASLQGSAQ
ncbi:MAG: alpha-2-macroglobulin family protein, partial [Rubrivivax sp.]|nr:alpha-2-macroglobulin family protein [Rubrivivax sp.]